MSDEETVQELDTAIKRACGLVVDFDYAFVDGIGMLEKVCTKILGSAGVTVTPLLFARNLFGSKSVSAVTALLGPGATTSAETVLASIPLAMDKAIENAHVNAKVLEICKQAAEQGIKVLFVTSRSLGIVEQKLESVGIQGAQLFKVDRCDRLGEYAGDVWVKAARHLRLSPRHCTVIAASATSIREGVVAGMRTAAFTHPLISFQDFSGADFVADGAPPETVVSRVMELICSQFS